MGWAVDLIIFHIQNPEDPEKQTSFRERFFAGEIYFRAIFFSFIGMGFLISIPVLVNLTRQRQSVSFQGENVFIE